MSRRVVITGLGVVSSIGIGWREFWGSLLQGRSGISPVTSIDTSKHFTHNGGEVKNFRAEQFIPSGRLDSMDRAAHFGLAAAKLAVEDASLTKDVLAKEIAGVSHGTTMGAIHAIEAIDQKLVSGRPVGKGLAAQLMTHSVPALIAKEYGMRGPNAMFTTACAAGNYAIAHAFDLVRSQRAEIVLAGASDPFSRIEYTGFNQFSAVAPDKCQPFDKNRKGMMLAEGAAILVIESLEHALARNAPLYAEVRGYGLSCDAFHMTTARADGIAECMRKALRESGISPEEVDYISAHGTGTIANDRAECAAIREVFGGRCKHIPISSLKSMIGHAMGAASALEAVACALVVKEGVVPATINYETPDPECDIDCVPNTARRHAVNVALNNSYAFGGNNAVVVMQKLDVH